jgi:hypothetical protein
MSEYALQLCLVMSVSACDPILNLKPGLLDFNSIYGMQQKMDINPVMAG